MTKRDEVKIMKKCPRCSGRGDIFLCAGGGYSMIDTGGKKVKCPLCMGKNFVEMPKKRKSKVVEKQEAKPEGVST